MLDIKKRLLGFSVKRTLNPHFDKVYYLGQLDATRSDIRDPIQHYISDGVALGLDPSEEFSTNFYLASNIDVARSGLNPFWHFIKFGRAENRLGRPLEAPDGSTDNSGDIDPTWRSIVQEFDPSFYRSRYDDLPDTDEDLVKHYCSTGWRLGHDPNAHFSTRNYLENNPDVAANNENPFVHYVRFGKSEGRHLQSSDQQTTPLNELAVDPVKEIENVVLPYFDADYYLDQNPDVAKNGISAIVHFCSQGWLEGRDPNREFSTQYYLESNPDIKDSEVNPFWHYIVAGKSEGRAIQHPGGYKFKILQELRSLEDVVSDWKKKSDFPDILSSKELIDGILGAAPSGGAQIILSISHDHYRKNVGGVQFCMQREEVLATEAGVIYVNLHPWQPLPRLAHIEDNQDPIVCLVRNGQDLGYSRMSGVIQAVDEMAGQTVKVEVVVHHLLGHLPEQIIELVQATGTEKCKFWLHDFVTLCPSFTLQRNSITFCNAPNLSSNACSLCVYGDERKDHLTRVTDLFEALDVHVLAPSRSAKKQWLSGSKLKTDKISIIPHMKLEWKKRKEPKKSSFSSKISIGFLGTAAVHKGWPVFERLVSEFYATGKYQFIYFGNSKPKLRGLKCVDVQVTMENPTAMIDAVEREQVDLVLHWASWPETFSLSTFEALSGGAFVITNSISGNVADTIRRLKRGCVLSGEKALSDFFAGGRVTDLTYDRRSTYQRFEVHRRLSRMSHVVSQKDY